MAKFFCANAQERLPALACPAEYADVFYYVTDAKRLAGETLPPACPLTSGGFLKNKRRGLKEYGSWVL